MDDVRDIKVEPSESNGNLNPDEYLEWVQAMDWIFEAKGYDDEKSFKVASSLIIGKERIVLNSLPPNQVYKTKARVRSKKKRDILMFSETRVERALSIGKQVLALLTLESNKSEEVTPPDPKIGPLISQYQDVFPQD